MKLLCWVVVMGVFIAVLPAASEDRRPVRRHRIEIGHGVPVCVWGPNFVSRCGFGGADFHGAYLYRLHRRFSVGVFVNAGFVIAVDLGLTLRTWIILEYFYCDLHITAMAPRGVSIDRVWFYGGELAVGASLPKQGRVRFFAEIETVFLFNQYGNIDFLRPVMGLVLTL